MVMAEDRLVLEQYVWLMGKLIDEVWRHEPHTSIYTYGHVTPTHIIQHHIITLSPSPYESSSTHA